MRPLDLLTEQLWAPALAAGARARVSSDHDPDWRVVESYRLVPDAPRVRLLVPDGPRTAVLGALRNYRRLRRPRENGVRALLGAGARAGALNLLPRLVVEVPRGDDPASHVLPVPLLASALDVDEVYASIGVRTGANRKATLQLVDRDGRPVGYAKIGWNAVTDHYVATEREALRTLSSAGAMRAPKLLATCDYHGHPVIVTEPLPTDARGCHRDPGLPSAREVYSLCPVERVDTVATSGQLRTLRERLALLESSPTVATVVGQALALHDRVVRVPDPLPISARWHGDLTSWNCARTGDGTLWAWDWESSEVDAVAGLDAVHWEFSRLRLGARSPADVRLAECLDGARGLLTAAGTPSGLHGVVGATYALTVVERAASLASREGDWTRVWIQPQALTGLLAEAAAIVGAG